MPRRRRIPAKRWFAVSDKWMVRSKDLRLTFMHDPLCFKALNQDNWFKMLSNFELLLLNVEMRPTPARHSSWYRTNWSHDSHKSSTVPLLPTEGGKGTRFSKCLLGLR